MRILLTTTIAAVLLSSSAVAETFPGSLPDQRVAKGSRGITAAWLAEPTTRYRHFVLGARYEAASLRVRTTDGLELQLRLPKHAVFEDRIPRLADLDGDGRDEIVVVKSTLDRGAAISIIGVRNGRLEIIAETQPTGSSNTWVNPAGIADFDGDGRLDIAFVQMPHVLGRLRVVTLRDGTLVETMRVEDTSNHVAGSAHLELAAVADFDGDGIADLAIPSLDRRSLRFLRFKRGVVEEIARKPLPAAAVSDFRLEEAGSGAVVVVGLEGGRQVRVRPR